MKQGGFILVFQLAVILSYAQSGLQKNVADSAQRFLYPIITQNYYTKNMSPICKKELEIQKRTKVNVFFRLGSKSYVDYLEQKPNATKGFN
ncbi:MAG: hypothetical protein ABIN57_13305 [Chitinophagaceae bacterium]